MAHHGGKMGRAHSKSSKEARRKTVVVRSEEREKRSPKEQLALLDVRLGRGVGAKKERARLQELLTEKPKPIAVAEYGKGLSAEEKAAKIAARKAALAAYKQKKDDANE